MFTLMDCDSCAMHGTSFPTLDAAREYALSLRALGLCFWYRIGCYENGKWKPVYEGKIA